MKNDLDYSDLIKECYPNYWSGVCDTLLVKSHTQFKKGDYFMKDGSLMIIQHIKIPKDVVGDFGWLLLRNPTESEIRDYKLTQLGI